ncbi:MAG TPA: carboxypeptidase-like regulatory domain-containing protein [Vicinamibacterales bacterium]|nr:carboxypeptidase-like regulatory domain-containing protein [Vicinamibacterales bacterium]
MIGALLLTVAVQAPQAAAAGAAIRGRVTNAESRPLAGVLVRLQRTGDGSGPEPPPVRVDDSGVFEATNIPPGDYTLFATRTGYQPGRYPERVGQTIGPLSLGPGETKDRITIVLRRFGAIAGRILDRNGDPVEGVLVSALLIPPRALRGQRAAAGTAPARSTNDLGEFRVYNVPPGDYFVVASAAPVNGLERAILPGHGRTFFPGSASAADAQVVHVAGSDTVAGIDFALAPARLATVAGQMLSSTGQAFQGGIQMHLSHRSGVDLGAVGAYTYPDGRFEFRSVSPGEYVIESQNNNERALQYVSVDGTDVTGVVVQTQKGSTIEGRLVFEGNTPPARIAGELLATTLEPDSVAVQYRTSIRPDGTFQLTNVFGARLLRFSGNLSGWTVKQILAAGNDVTDSFVLFGSAGQSLKDVQIVLIDQSTRLSGTVADWRGNPPAGGTVIVFADDSAKWTPITRFVRTASVQSDGTFSTAGLPSGGYFVAAVTTLPDGGLVEAIREPEFLEPLSREAAHVVLNERQSVGVSLHIVKH